MANLERFRSRARAFYNNAASTYDTSGYGIATRIIHPVVMNLLTLSESQSLLDVGCGTGELLVAIAEQYSTSSVKLAGVDIADSMISRAGTRTGFSVDLRVADSAALPFDDNTFNVVVSSYAFHHFPEPERALAEVRRVLVPGGRFVLADTWFPSPQRAIINHIIVPFRSEGDFRIYSRNEISRLLAAQSLVLQEWKVMNVNIIGWGTSVLYAE